MTAIVDLYNSIACGGKRKSEALTIDRKRIISEDVKKVTKPYA